MTHPLDAPFDTAALLLKKRALRRELQTQTILPGKRLAILGGSTTSEIKDWLELFLLHQGIQAKFYESEYNRFEEDALFGNPELDAFKPEIAILFSSWVNLRRFPDAKEEESDCKALLQSEVERFRACWDALSRRYACSVIQNNFEEPPLRLFGNLDASDWRGRTHFVRALNSAFAQEARGRKDLWIHDLGYLAACRGLDAWHDRKLWFLAKHAMSLEGQIEAAHSLASLILAMLGRSAKVLVLDLDNTAWGGVIGDQGVEGIRLGQGTPEGEAHSALQAWAMDLKSRGILLSVASKNEEAIALEGIAHADSLIRAADLAALKANWDPKPGNLQAMALELSLGADSMVFVDDNPAERELMRQALPMVKVPELPEDPADFPWAVDRSGYFEASAITEEDLGRSGLYAAERGRREASTAFTDYDAFLASLQMEAEIGPVHAAVLERSAQLINKSNQFNLTTRRLTETELRGMLTNPGCVTLYGRLKDRFGDHGLISVVIGAIKGEELEVVFWVMSCRVLKRGMEVAMLDALVEAAQAKGLRRMKGIYLPTPRNAMVRLHYQELGFKALDREPEGHGSSAWLLELSEPRLQAKHIRRGRGGE